MSRLGEMLDSFVKKIEYVRKGPMGVPKLLTINLAVALTDQVYNISGNVFYIWSAPDESSYVGIKVNQTSEPSVLYSVHTGLKTPYHKLLITTPADQAGDLVLLYGTEAPDLLEIIDNRSTTVAGVGGLLDELRGDVVAENFTGVTVGVGALVIMAARADRKGCSVQAAATNISPIWLGFDNTLTVPGAPGTWWAELQPGAGVTMDDYRGPLWAISGAAAQIVGTGEW